MPITLFEPDFPLTTKIEKMEDSQNEYIVVNCENNFNSLEKTVIDSYNIYTMNDLIHCEHITKQDKDRLFVCFENVRKKYVEMGIEPYNSQVSIQMAKYIIMVRIMSDNRIIYCKSLGIINS
jgi:hypothetical protein